MPIEVLHNPCCFGVRFSASNFFQGQLWPVSRVANHKEVFSHSHHAAKGVEINISDLTITVFHKITEAADRRCRNVGL